MTPATRAVARRGIVVGTNSRTRSMGAARLSAQATVRSAIARMCETCDGEGGYIVLDDMGDECRHGYCRTCGRGRDGSRCSDNAPAREAAS